MSVYEFAYLFGSLAIAVCCAAVLIYIAVWAMLKAVEGFAKAMDEAIDEEVYGKKK